ncbi:hypothetical protein G6F35_017300 [Rhizopus arrhizus]|nr:hypothetical protein G6F35_017300 [Rhizopus arrhizus]
MARSVRRARRGRHSVLLRAGQGAARPGRAQALHRPACLRAWRHRGRRGRVSARGHRHGGHAAGDRCRRQVAGGGQFCGGVGHCPAVGRGQRVVAAFSPCAAGLRVGLDAAARQPPPPQYGPRFCGVRPCGLAGSAAHHP